MTTTRIKRWLVTLSLAIVSFASQAVNNLEINQATVRVLPPQVKNTAAFLTITNNSDKAITLTRASSEISDTIEFHDHILENETMKMVQLPHIKLEAQQTLKLQSGGLHLMIFNLKQPLKHGQQIEFSLFDEQNNQYNFTATAGEANEHIHHHHH